MATVYRYVTGGQTLEWIDENDAYKPGDIRAHWAQSFPALSEAPWDETKDAEGRTVREFKKKVGTKG